MKIIYESKINNKIFPNYNITPKPGYIILYHNTTYDKAKQIQEQGLKCNIGKEQGRGKDGDFVWATSTPNLKGYGGTTIAFQYSEEKAKNCKVNEDQYTIPEDIPSNDILFIDFPIIDNFRIGDLKDLINKYGKDKIIEVFKKRANKINSDYTIYDLLDYVDQAIN